MSDEWVKREMDILHKELIDKRTRKGAYKLSAAQKNGIHREVQDRADKILKRIFSNYNLVKL